MKIIKDKTNYEFTESDLSLCGKGQKFVPKPLRRDLTKKFDEFSAFSRKLHLAVYHQRKKREREHEGASSFKEGSENGVQNSDSYDSGDSALESEITRYPWTPKSTFDPQLGVNPALEEFLT